MKPIWQISLAHLILLVFCVCLYLGFRSSILKLMPVSGSAFTFSMTAVFFILERYKEWRNRPIGWGEAIRCISPAWFSGSLIGVDFAESLRQEQGYWDWASDWGIFVAWTGIQLALAIFTYLSGRVSLALYRFVRQDSNDM